MHSNLEIQYDITRNKMIRLERCTKSSNIYSTRKSCGTKGIRPAVVLKTLSVSGGHTGHFVHVVVVYISTVLLLAGVTVAVVVGHWLDNAN